MTANDIVLLFFGASITIVLAMIAEWERSKGARQRDFDLFAKEQTLRQEQYEYERSVRKEQYERERAEREQHRRLERRRHTLEALQDELIPIRSALLQYRNSSHDVILDGPDLLRTDEQWLEWQKTMWEAIGKLNNIHSRIDDDELKTHIEEIVAVLHETWSERPDPSRADIAQVGLEASRKARSRSGELLQTL